jgi:hypothetical protein
MATEFAFSDEILVLDGRVLEIPRVTDADPATGGPLRG